MRWLVGAAVALLLVWAWYMASPYLALWNLATALEQRDTARLSDHVNVRALRVSLSRQLAAEEVATARAGPISAPDRQAAAAALAALADPVMEHLLTPGGILDLLRASAGSEAPDQPGRRVKLSARSFTELIAASRWRGFRNVYFALPPEEPPERRFRLQFRLSRFKWRLTTIDLPEAVRQRLAGELMRRVRAADPER